MFFLQTLKRSHSFFFALLLESVLVQDSEEGKVLRCCTVGRAVLDVYSIEEIQTHKLLWHVLLIKFFGSCS